ncbi:MAG TPA: SURF1 family protein [Burkholderiales bacterium]|nr:SURF1 family protein [Burkholderiales bacterium]
MAEPARRGSLWPLVATLAGIGVAVALGTWQLGRAQEKRELKAHVDALAAQPPIRVPGVELAAAEVELRPVEARGVFDPRHTVYIDNRIHRGVPGYHVVTPLRIEGSDRHVLVNRGWIAAAAQRSRLPEVPTPSATVAVSGIAVIPRKRTLELSDQVMEGRVWQNLTIERYRSARPLAVQPFVIRQATPLADGLVREWPAPDLGIEKHYGYAFQWFALAAALLVFYAATRYRRRKA